MAARAAAVRVTTPSGLETGVELGSGTVTIGRRAPEHTPDIALDPDPQRWVGRVHCTLDFADGMWAVSDNDSVNGTLLRHGGAVTRLEGRKRIQHGDEIRILGDMTPDGEPLYWTLTFLDPHATQTSSFEPPVDVRSSGPRLRYDWLAATAYRCANGTETAVTGLRPQGHQLLRYMAGRGRSGASVACEHTELITALWGDRDEWPAHRSYTRGDLAGVIRAVRRVLEPDPAHPRILETVPKIGYRLHVHADSPPPEPV